MQVANFSILEKSRLTEQTEMSRKCEFQLRRFKLSFEVKARLCFRNFVDDP